MKVFTLIAIAAIAPCALWAGNFDIVDPEELQKQKQEWRAINIEYLNLKRELEKTRQQLEPLKGVEDERAQLQMAADRGAELARFVSERRYRVWTSASGAKINARVTQSDETVLHLKNEQGEEVVVRRADLSEADQGYLARIDRLLDPGVPAPEAAEAAGPMGLNATKTKTIRIYKESPR